MHVGVSVDFALVEWLCHKNEERKSMSRVKLDTPIQRIIGDCWPIHSCQWNFLQRSSIPSCFFGLTTE